jgi:hypothetical protein
MILDSTVVHCECHLSTLEYLQCMEMGSVTDVSKVYSASIFKFYPDDGSSVCFRKRKTPNINRIQRVEWMSARLLMC